jgi:hypothetical protein
LILNLNEPTRITDTTWIKPQKMVGVWWEMHVNKATWNYSDVNNVKLDGTDWGRLKPNGRHGANTAGYRWKADGGKPHGTCRTPSTPCGTSAFSTGLKSIISGFE